MENILREAWVSGKKVILDDEVPLIQKALNFGQIFLKAYLPWSPDFLSIFKLTLFSKSMAHRNYHAAGAKQLALQSSRPFQEVLDWSSFILYYQTKRGNSPLLTSNRIKKKPAIPPQVGQIFQNLLQTENAMIITPILVIKKRLSLWGSRQCKCLIRAEPGSRPSSESWPSERSYSHVIVTYPKRYMSELTINSSCQFAKILCSETFGEKVAMELCSSCFRAMNLKIESTLSMKPGQFAIRGGFYDVFFNFKWAFPTWLELFVKKSKASGPLILSHNFHRKL